MKRGILVLLAGLAAVLVLLPGRVLAEFNCEVRTNRSSVPRGGEVVLTVTAEGDVGWSADFRLPAIEGARVYDGGTNQSMSMVNGRTRTSVSRTWYLRVEGEGTLRIGPVTVTAKNESCETEAIELQVVAAEAAPPPADTGNRAVRPGTAAPEGRPGSDIFVTLTADRDEAWIGEQIILSFRYWCRVQPWNNPSYTPPRTEGFWREDLGPERRFREVRNGRAYSVTEIRYALFPTRAGDLVIEPAELAFPQDVFDRFFNSRRRSQGPRVLRTERLTIAVKPLPTPAPAGFSGLVANDLTLAAEVSPDTVPAGEAVQQKLQLDADGFLKGFSGLEVAAPAGARMHDAAESFEVKLRGDRLRGRLVVEKVLVPDEEGVLTVPSVALVWFDADRDRYVTTGTPVHRVQVTPGHRGGAADESSGFLRSEIARLGEDLAFIHPVPRSLRRDGVTGAGSALWWSLLLAPPVLLTGWRFYLSRAAAERRDPAGRRRRRALAQALAGIKSAGDDPAALARAITGYVADRTDRPQAAVGAAEVVAYGESCGLAARGRELADLLTACDSARFGGGAAASGPQMAGQARSALEELEAAARDSGRSGRVGGAGLTAGVLLLTVAWGLGTAAAQRPGPDPVRLTAEANQAYTTGDLARARALYLEARDLGVDDPVLHYNLGNTHAREGDLGRAVASWTRARRLAPRDADIQANLVWVKRHLRDLELVGGELPLFIRQFVAVVEFFTVDELAWTLIALAWLLMLLVAWAWYREEFGDGLRRGVLLLAGLLLLVLAVTGWRWYGEHVVDRAVVIAEEAEVHSGPAETFPVLFKVHDGLTVSLDGQREGWVRISLGGDWQGWMPLAAVERIRLEPVQGR